MKPPSARRAAGASKALLPCRDSEHAVVPAPTAPGNVLGQQPALCSSNHSLFVEAALSRGLRSSTRIVRQDIPALVFESRLPVLRHARLRRQSKQHDIGKDLYNHLTESQAPSPIMPAADGPDGEVSEDAQQPSDSGGEQDDGPQRDILEGTDAAVLLRALSDAVAEPSAFIQPSVQIADVARQATKVGELCLSVNSIYGAYVSASQ